MIDRYNCKKEICQFSLEGLKQKILEGVETFSSWNTCLNLTCTVKTLTCVRLKNKFLGEISRQTALID